MSEPKAPSKSLIRFGSSFAVIISSALELKRERLMYSTLVGLIEDLRLPGANSEPFLDDAKVGNSNSIFSFFLS